MCLSHCLYFVLLQFLIKSVDQFNYSQLTLVKIFLFHTNILLCKGNMAMEVMPSLTPSLIQKR